MTWEGVLQKNLSQSPWSSMIQLGFPWFSLVPYPFSHHFSHQKKRWPDPSAPAGADESPRSDPARGAPLPGPRESMGKNEEKNIKKTWETVEKPDEIWWNGNELKKHGETSVTCSTLLRFLKCRRFPEKSGNRVTAITWIQFRNTDQL